MEAIQNYLAQHGEGGSSSGSEDLNNERIKELKVMVTKWSELDEQARKTARLARSYTEMKKDYESKILEFMKENDIEQLNTRGLMIQCVTKPRKKKVSMDQLLGAIPDADIRRRVEALAAGSTSRTSLRKVSLV